MPATRSAAALALVLAMAGAACSDDDDEDRSVATTITSVSTSTTTAVPSVATPQEAAAEFIAAWMVGDRERMLAVTDGRHRAADELVDLALGLGRPVGEPDCYPQHDGHHQCVMDMGPGEPQAYILAGPPGSDLLVSWVGQVDGT